MQSSVAQSQLAFFLSKIPSLGQAKVARLTTAVLCQQDVLQFYISANQRHVPLVNYYSNFQYDPALQVIRYLQFTVTTCFRAEYSKVTIYLSHFTDHKKEVKKRTHKTYNFIK
jgi:hypothetical protein